MPDTITFEDTITDRIDFETAAPRSGSTGDFESVITDRIDFLEFVEIEVAPASDSQAAYLAGEDTSISSQSAFLAAEADPFSVVEFISKRPRFSYIRR